jgi:hypothetical protein
MMMTIITVLRPPLVKRNNVTANDVLDQAAARTRNVPFIAPRRDNATLSSWERTRYSAGLPKPLLILMLINMMEITWATFSK